MHRRNILAGAFAAAGGLCATVMGGARARAASPDKLKVVYHLCDLDKVAFVLGNIGNHFEGMGGADKVTIALVVHGPALKAFHSKSANAELARRVGENVTLKDLLPGFIPGRDTARPGRGLPRRICRCAGKCECQRPRTQYRGRACPLVPLRR